MFLKFQIPIWARLNNGCAPPRAGGNIQNLEPHGAHGTPYGAHGAPNSKCSPPGPHGPPGRWALGPMGSGAHGLRGPRAPGAHGAPGAPWGPHGAPWAPVLFSAFGSGSFFGFWPRFFFLLWPLDIFSARCIFGFSVILGGFEFQTAIPKLAFSLFWAPIGIQGAP